MITQRQQELFLDELSEAADVQDVYFHKDILYVINSYDIPYVEKFLDTTQWGAIVGYRYVEEDQINYSEIG